jgi:uncharacterized protein YjeT (DUF2065 family)
VDPLSTLCVLIGALIIAGRGPMIFAPAATLRFANTLLSTDARIRGIAVVLTPLAVALIALPLGEGEVAGILGLFGWLWAAAALWLLAAPGSYRRIAGGVVSYFESSVDEAVVRMIGVVAVAIGVALIYFGLYVA